MKLPQLETASAHVSMPGQGQFYSHATMNNPTMEGVELNGIFDSIWGGIKDVAGGILGGLGSAVGKIPCVLSKAGPQGVACITKCGPNPGCLATCAGPNLVSSIMSCL